jgi:hypothetical protein
MQTAPKAAFWLGSLIALTLTSGCATIVNGRSADVTLQSTPPNAMVTVRDDQGVVIAQTTTPGKVTLKRSQKFLRPAHYTATFEKPGYEIAEAPIQTKVNPWVLGNIVLGGPLGLGVDAVSGALWRPADKTIEQSLAAAGSLEPWKPPYDPSQPANTDVRTASAEDESQPEIY